MPTHDIALVLSGGVALGSYQAGAWEALQDDASVRVTWIAGSSVGALNGALIAGGSPDGRLPLLEEYWLRGTAWNPQLFPLPFAPLRHSANWLSVLQARLFGSPRHVQTNLLRTPFASLYSLDPTVAFIRARVDFDRLNGGDIRFTACATDIETGDAVYFDTAKGDRIGIDHLLASCGFLPEFSPVDIAGRLLGDGGLIANAPLEPVLDEVEGTEALVLVVDLFDRRGERPTGLESALARKNALLFGNQTYARLDLYRKLWKRHCTVHPSVLYMSYQPFKGEAGAEMPFDFSHASAEQRWRTGVRDAQAAIGQCEAARLSNEIITVVRREPHPQPTQG
jgi:NTE family protein